MPVIARIEGTNIELGRKLFADSGLQIQMIPSLDEAAGLVVAKAKETRSKLINGAVIWLFL